MGSLRNSAAQPDRAPEPPRRCERSDFWYDALRIGERDVSGMDAGERGARGTDKVGGDAGAKVCAYDAEGVPPPCRRREGFGVMAVDAGEPSGRRGRVDPPCCIFGAKGTSLK